MARPLTTVDYHTAGEPFRIVTGGADEPAGTTVLDRRTAAMSTLDDVRALLVNEPRGHAGMYGCFVTPPDDTGAVVGLVFFHKDGFSTACGHGTIAAATWAIDTGLVRPVHPVTHLSVDVPSGRLRVEADVDGDGRVGEVRFTNVASWVSATDVPITAAGRDWLVDIAFGGAFYASVAASVAGLRVELDDLAELRAIGQEIKHAVDVHPAVQHPTDDRLSGCYGTIWWEPSGATEKELHQRNVTIFADGEIDRSPCGSGTSARLAILHASGGLNGRRLRHGGIVGGEFVGRVIAEVDGPRGRAVTTQIGGRAFRTGSHEFTLDERDPLGVGFQLG